jgi:phenylpropionate dioxygenase-like ring-hydroxylating dioxygenase large terminal subunit
MSSVSALSAESHSTPRRALPAWVYNHPEMTRLELERILKPSWQIVCHVNSVPESGDFITFDLGPESVIVLRDKAGTIRAHHNVCRHRGTRIYDGSGNCRGAITCPYHGWTYQYDGSLLATPMRDSFPDLDRSEYGLRPVRVEIMLGFVFVCLAGDPPRPTQVWSTMIEEFAPYRFDELVPISPMYTEEWAVDWKIAMDNYLESYHVPLGHPGLNRMFTPDYEDTRSAPGIGRGVSWMHEQPSSRWMERVYLKHVGAVTQHLPEPNRRCWRFYSCLPNLGIDIMPEQVDFFQVLPNGPGKTIIRGAAFGLPDERREMKLVRYMGTKLNMQVNTEDRWLCERVQRGLRSSSYQPGPLSHLERWMHEFHELLRTRIPEVRLTSAPSVFA